MHLEYSDPRSRSSQQDGNHRRLRHAIIDQLQQELNRMTGHGQGKRRDSASMPCSDRDTSLLAKVRERARSTSTFLNKEISKYISRMHRQGDQRAGLRST